MKDQKCGKVKKLKEMTPRKEKEEKEEWMDKENKMKEDGRKTIALIHGG